MDLLVSPVAGPDDEARLRALFELYVYDFSELLPLDVRDDGRFATPPLDRHLADGRGHSFLFRSAGKLAGFALVSPRSYFDGDEGVHDLAEFFVMRRYRRHGLGARAAAAVFDQFNGRWEVRQKRENVAAIAFWRRVIGDYTGGRFEDGERDDERWRGAVQRFDNAR
jgi:predicted acetyltransferase